VTTAEPAGVRLGPADVGARVVVRRRLPEGQYGDVLGTLVSWAPEVVVQDRHGVLVRFPRADVVLGKRIPDPPARR
jgi:hypothetical protein